MTPYRPLRTPAQVPSPGEGPAGLLGDEPVSASTAGSLPPWPTLQTEQSLASSSTRQAGPGALTIDGESHLPSSTPALHLRPYLPAPKNAPPHLTPPPFVGGSALEPFRMLLAHRALPSRPERWARLGWKWGERREVGWALLTPLPSKGLLSWLQVEGPERQKQQGCLCAPLPASDSSSFSPWCHLPCMLRALPCCRTFRGSVQAFTRASSKSSQAGVQFFLHSYHRQLPSNTLSARLLFCLRPPCMLLSLQGTKEKARPGPECLIDFISSHLC